MERCTDWQTDSRTGIRTHWAPDGANKWKGCWYPFRLQMSEIWEPSHYSLTLVDSTILPSLEHFSELFWNGIESHSSSQVTPLSHSHVPNRLSIFTQFLKLSVVTEIENILRKFIPLSEMYQQVNEMCQHSTTNISNTKSTFWLLLQDIAWF